jgi:succinate dehydrogenase / fumarate reductase iron-sulfur subunit
MEHYNMNLTLKIWRQKNKQSAGSLETYQVKDISSEMSFLEMFDVLNEQLIVAGDDPIAFDHDCREGICGQCSMHIDGRAHGPWTNNTTCQLHMRAFKDGDTIVVEPWRSKAFPVIKDLMVDRSSFDRIIQAGGYVSVNTGNAVDANSLPIDGGRLHWLRCVCSNLC